MNIRAKIFGGAAEEPILKAKKPKGAKADTLHSVNVAREVRRANNSRGEDRHRLTDERARVTHDGTDLDVELVNLSGGGAMVAGAFEPMLWDRVDLHLGNHGTVECVVRWIRDGRVGLEFAHETRLDGPSDQIAILLRHVIERTFPHIEFPQRANAEKKDAEEKRDPNDHRDGRRHPLIWTGVLYHDYQTTKIRVRNISSTGAMIESETPIRVGAQPLLELSDAVSLSATVEWAVGDQAGLRFHDPFDMNMLADGKPTVVQEKWSPPPYLDLVAKANAKGEHWNRLTIVELREELEGFLKR